MFDMYGGKHLKEESKEDWGLHPSVVTSTQNCHSTVRDTRCRLTKGQCHNSVRRGEDERVDGRTRY